MLPLTEDPAGSGLSLGRGIGSIQTTSDTDWWSFTALAGDIVSVSVDRYQGSGLYPYACLYSASGGGLASDSQGGPNAGAFISHYTIPVSGTYFVQVNGNGYGYGYGTTGSYQMHVELARGIQQESDRGYANDSIGGANVITLAHAQGHLIATVAGTIMNPTSGDTDTYLLGTRSVGNMVELSTTLPSTSTLAAKVTLVDANGNLVTDTDGNPNDAHFLGTIPADGTYYAKVQSKQWVSTYNGHTYVTTNDNMSWTDAEAYAQSLGGHLVTINDQAEQDWLSQAFGPMSGLWIGLNRRPSDGVWVWSSGQASSYTNWASGQPNGYDGTYLNSNGQWYSYPQQSASFRPLIELDSSSLAPASPGPQAQYLLKVDVADLVAPQVTAVSPLPANNGSTDKVLDRLTLTVSKDLDATTVVAGNFDLRGAGTDGLFGTADDALYTLQVDPAYSTGTTLSLLVVNGPLGNGHYRFTAKAGLLDRSGNSLDGDGNGIGGDDCLRTFDVALPPGFIFEGRSNDTQATATALSVNPQTTADGSFLVLSSQSMGNLPDSVATGDFNSDGRADLVLANTGASNVTVLLGAGDGTFTSGGTYLTAGTASAVTVGDFNGDGKMDLAAAGSNNTVSVLLGNGDGTFANAIICSVGSNPPSIAVGDFNGDGKPDLVTANYGDNTVSVLLGKGNGMFNNAISYAVGSNPYSVAVGDINGDGRPDLVTANYGSANVSVLLAAAGGGFATAFNYAVGTNPRSMRPPK